MLVKILNCSTLTPGGSCYLLCMLTIYMCSMYLAVFGSVMV